MANVDRVNGLRPVKHMNGSPFNGQTNYYSIPASDGTAVFIGDLVKLGGSSDADGVQDVIQAAAGDTPVGVVTHFEPLATDLELAHRKASTLRYAYVADSPDLVCEVQEDADGGALALASVGLHADVIVAAGDATTGTSGMELDTSTAATTSTLVLRILGFVQRDDNTVASANAKVHVGFNVHQYGNVGIAGV